MICAAVVSGVDEFRRALRHRAPDAGVRLNLMLRMTAELTSASGLDVLILHQPSWDDIENVRSVTGTLPIVLVGAREIGPESVQDSAGWAVLSEDDPSAVLAAARAAAFGMAVIPAVEADSGPYDGDLDLSGAGSFAAPGGFRTSSGLAQDAVALTAREMDVLRLVAEGATNNDVAAALGISENTVKYHLGSLYHKLGVRRRSEMTFEAIRRGLISV